MAARILLKKYKYYAERLTEIYFLNILKKQPTDQSDGKR